MRTKTKCLTICFLLMTTTMTGCSTSMLSGDEVVLRGSPEGIAALGDVFTGMQIVSKTDQELLPQNPHTALRLAQERTKALRFTFKPKSGVK